MSIAAASDPTERALALFEGWVTELDARITALPRLFDPRTVPEGAMDWLSSFVALALDPRVGVDVRRQLEPEEHAAARGGPAHAAADLRVAAAEVPHFGCAEVSNFGCAEVPRQ